MKKFDIVTVLWDDHIAFERSSIIKNPADALTPTLTLGLLWKETKGYVVIISNVERYRDRDDANYIIILKGCIRGIRRYGKLKVGKLRTKSD
jgi:hypothetical protein